MSSNKLLMIFIKNLRPEISFHKNGIGGEEDKSSKIFKRMQSHALASTRHIECDKAVFYSEYLEQDDAWKLSKFQQHLQWGLDFGEKIENAFLLAFKRGYEKVILIGSECYALTPEIVVEAFESLEDHSVVLGPSSDGGYYLIGMKQAHSTLFKDKDWGMENVFLDTLIDVKNLNIPYKLLDTLGDINESEIKEEYFKAL